MYQRMSDARKCMNPGDIILYESVVCKMSLLGEDRRIEIVWHKGSRQIWGDFLRAIGKFFKKKKKKKSEECVKSLFEWIVLSI